MSLDLQRDNAYPLVKTITVQQTCTEILIPKTALRVQIGAQTKKLYWTSIGEDGQLLGAHKDFIEKGAKQTIHLGRGKNRHNAIYISTQASGSGTVTLVFSEE